MMANNTVKTKDLSNIAMVNGNEGKITAVIRNGILKEWVGIGWIELRVASEHDKEQYPTVVED